VIAERGRAFPVHGAQVSHSYAAIEAIKEIDGVQAAGRHVALG
jgi:hypothetical protein